MANQQKSANSRIAENCSEETLSLLEDTFRNLKDDRINTYIVSLDGKKLDFLENPKMADSLLQQYRGETMSGMFFSSALLLEVMKKNGVEKSLDGKSIEELQNFVDNTIKEDEVTINRNALKSGSLREICYETERSSKANVIVIFLRNMNIGVLQEVINDYLYSKISSNARYSLRLFSDNKLCTYKNIFRRNITSPVDFENLDLTTDEAVAEYIHNIKENFSEQPSGPRPSLRR